MPGDDLKLSLEKYVKEQNIYAGCIVTCVGSLKRAVIRMANASGPTEMEQKFEIVSLVGTLSVDGCHVHICLSDENGVVTGGHLLPGNIIYTTAEIIIAELPGIRFSRQQDERTGFKELVINNK